jgi:hypothetical protein
MMKNEHIRPATSQSFAAKVIEDGFYIALSPDSHIDLLDPDLPVKYRPHEKEDER